MKPSNWPFEKETWISKERSTLHVRSHSVLTAVRAMRVTKITTCRMRIARLRSESGGASVCIIEKITKEP